VLDPLPRNSTWFVEYTVDSLWSREQDLVSLNFVQYDAKHILKPDKLPCYHRNKKGTQATSMKQQYVTVTDDAVLVDCDRSSSIGREGDIMGASVGDGRP
jgi:hypothetical protein